MTGKAERSISSLDITESNYTIALNVLRNKFDFHRRICMQHWRLILDYPNISKETPEAIDDFLKTVKLNLAALEKLEEPVTSNVVLVELLTSKLPSSTISIWHHTLPDKRMPSYTHLIDFLTARTNGDQPIMRSQETEESTHHRPNRRYRPSRG